MIYTAETELAPGDVLCRRTEFGDDMIVASPAYDEKDRVVIENAHAGRVLGNRNRAPRFSRYTRNSPILRGRAIRKVAA